MAFKKTWIASICLFFSIAVSAQTIDKIIVFGDSLSDNGNFYALVKGYAPQNPYYYGRYSNGLVWAEILTSKMHMSPVHLDDYAIAGAETYGIKPPGLKTQVKKYLNSHTVDPNALYIIWSGGDNYIYHPHAGPNAVNSAIDDINQVITELAQNGAQTFLVPNLPDIGVTPLAANWDKEHPKLKTAKHLTWLSTTHNSKLKSDLPQLAENLGVKIIPMNIYGIMSTAIKYPAKYNLTNVTDRCYTGEFHGGGGSTCNNPDEYLFWDWVHPTTKMHNLLAGVAYDTLTKNGIKGEQS